MDSLKIGNTTFYSSVSNFTQEEVKSKFGLNENQIKELEKAFKLKQADEVISTDKKASAKRKTIKSK